MQAIADDVSAVGRGELTDRAWAVIEPLLPRSEGRAGRWRDHRQVINGILWKLRTRAPWRVEWTVSVDSSIVRAHQHATGARKKGGIRWLRRAMRAAPA